MGCPTSLIALTGLGAASVEQGGHIRGQHRPRIGKITLEALKTWVKQGPTCYGYLIRHLVAMGPCDTVLPPMPCAVSATWKQSSGFGIRWSNP